ncbi:MAG: formate dehydrogenase subunit gamma [Pirellulaceae bacterium]
MTQPTSRIEAIVEAHRLRPGATLPILHDIQADFGYIPDEAIGIIATGLNLSRAEIFGVVTFYADFRTTAPGRHVVQVCRGEACQAMGGEALECHAKSKLGVDFHGTSSDKSITLEPVFCLGNCGCSPSVRVGDEILGRVDPDSFDELVDELRKDGGR